MSRAVGARLLKQTGERGEAAQKLLGHRLPAASPPLPPPRPPQSHPLLQIPERSISNNNSPTIAAAALLCGVSPPPLLLLLPRGLRQKLLLRLLLFPRFQIHPQQRPQSASLRSRLSWPRSPPRRAASVSGAARQRSGAGTSSQGSPPLRRRARRRSARQPRRPRDGRRSTRSSPS